MANFMSLVNCNDCFYDVLFWLVCRQDVISLVKLMFSTLTVAMRFEPANARFFATEVTAFQLFL